MRVPEEPVRIDLFRQNPVFTSLQLKSPVHVVPPQPSEVQVVHGCTPTPFHSIFHHEQRWGMYAPAGSAVLQIHSPISPLHL
jgi:hypothetical protein